MYIGNSRDDTSVSVVDAASSLANKLGALKNELGDLDDAHAQVMRQLLLSRGEVCINIHAYVIM
jgi:CHAD domain-containing protein